MYFIRYSLLLLIFILCFTLFFQGSCYAHRMLVELVEEGKILVRYDDGHHSGTAMVQAFGKNGEVLFEKQVDSQGYVNYAKDLEVYRIVADDQIGHRASWSRIHKEEHLIYMLPMWIRALIGIAVLLFCATLFYYRSSVKPVN